MRRAQNQQFDILDTICHVKPVNSAKKQPPADVADVVSVFSRSRRSSPEALNGDESVCQIGSGDEGLGVSGFRGFRV